MPREGFEHNRDTLISFQQDQVIPAAVLRTVLVMVVEGREGVEAGCGGLKTCP